MNAPRKDLGALWLQNQLLLREVNGARFAAGVRPLKVDDRLAAAAWDQASHCSVAATLTHIGPGGTRPWDRIAKYGYPWRAAGENIGQTPERGGSARPPDPDAIATSARLVVDDWLTADPWHRAIVLGDWLAMGCAASPARVGTYWVADFAR